jgi:hypothetical protein
LLWPPKNAIFGANGKEIAIYPPTPHSPASFILIGMGQGMALHLSRVNGNSDILLPQTSMVGSTSVHCGTTDLPCTGAPGQKDAAHAIVVWFETHKSDLDLTPIGVSVLQNVNQPLAPWLSAEGTLSREVAEQMLEVSSHPTRDQRPQNCPTHCSLLTRFFVRAGSSESRPG